MSAALLPTVIVLDLGSSLAWIDLISIAELRGVVVDDLDRAVGQLEALHAAGVDPDALVIGPGVEAPVAAAMSLHAAAPLVQVVFVAADGSGDRLRREIALTPRLGSGWTIVAPSPDEVGAAVAAAARASRRRHRLRASVARAKVRRDRDGMTRRLDGGQRKTELVALIADELCNPLAAIGAALALLEVADPASTETARARAVIARKHRALCRLVDGLVDVSRLADDTLDVELVRTELTPVLARAVETVAPGLERRGIALTTALPSEPMWVDADPDRIEQVVTQLLANAMKYTDRGGRVWLTAAPVGPAGGPRRAVIAVRDTGIGIADDVHEHVFEMFAHAPRRRDRARDGLGIGLTLARRLVELHGGEITASSAGPGKGSELAIRLPLADGPPEVAAEPGTGGRALRILVIEDDPDTADMLELVLRHAGHDVRAAHDGAHALAVAATFRPEVVVVDSALPGMSSADVAGRLRASDPGPAPVVVALGGHDRSAHAFDHHFIHASHLDRLHEVLDRLRR